MGGTRMRTLFAMVIGTLLITLAPSPATASARPKPDLPALRAQADMLDTRLEQLTEAYDGTQVQLQQEQQAAVAEVTDARQAAVSLTAVESKIGRFAAIRYMMGDQEEPAALFGATNPLTLLDQSATLHYFIQADDSRVTALTDAIQTAQRSQAMAKDRTAEAIRLRAAVARQKATIEAMLDKVRAPILADVIDRASKGEPIPPIPTGSSKALGAVRAALSQLGVRYVWGGASPKQGFDCSGLTMWAYKQVGIDLPHYGGDQWNAGVHVSRADLEPGDLVFFYSDIHHMGMYIGDGKFVHAPHTGAVVQISDLSSRPLAGAVRVTE
jgi:peptidoglycan DL-endopeptidase CwlO